MTEIALPAERLKQFRESKASERERERAMGHCLSNFKGCEVLAEVRPDGTFKRRCAHCATVQKERDQKRYKVAKQNGGLPWQRRKRDADE